MSEIESERFASRKVKVETLGDVDKWSIAKAILVADILSLLNDDWEPYAVEDGFHWFKKKR